MAEGVYAMLTLHESAFGKVGRFLIELALLLLLSAGLVRIVAPELHSIIDELSGRSVGKAEKSSTAGP